MRIRIANSVDAFWELLPLTIEDPNDRAMRQPEIDARNALIAEVQQHFADGAVASATEIYDRLAPIIGGGGSDKVLARLMPGRSPETDGEKLIWLARRSIGRIVYGGT